MRAAKLALIAVIGSTLFSCQAPNPFESEIAKVDTLLMQIDTAQKIHAQIDTSGFDKLSAGFTMKNGFIQSHYSQGGDTIQKDLAFLLADYKTLRKPYKNFTGKYAASAKELEFSKNQLLNLKHDLENNLLDTNVVPRLLNDEAEAVNRVFEDTKGLELMGKNTMALSAEIEPKIDSVITVLKQIK